MKSKYLATSLLSGLLCLGPVCGMGETRIRKTADDHFEVMLNRSSAAPVTALQVTDLHLGKKDFWKQDLTTFKRIRRLVEMHNPDLIFVTGDLLTGEKYFGSLLAAFAVEFFDSLQRPWFYTFGNHDVEGGFGRDQIHEVFASSRWCLLGFHQVTNQWARKYDYVVDLKRSTAARPEWQVYAFDTGSEKGFKSIKEDQIAWFQSVSETTRKTCGHTVRAVSIFHIPLRQYQELWDDAAIPKTGERKETVSFEEDDGSPLRAFVQMNNIEATFCGHDHHNNFWGKTRDGIILSYGYISGEATKYAWPTGGKLIRLPLKAQPINIQNVTPQFPDSTRQ
jgi:3',5'-cyclic AMP phosphodiesterase CpdA